MESPDVTNILAVQVAFSNFTGSLDYPNLYLDLSSSSTWSYYDSFASKI